MVAKEKMPKKTEQTQNKKSRILAYISRRRYRAGSFFAALYWRWPPLIFEGVYFFLLRFFFSFFFASHFVEAMSFHFDWLVFSNKDVVQNIRDTLNHHIKSDKNGEKVGSMHITELNFGKQVCDLVGLCSQATEYPCLIDFVSQAPEVEVSEVNELSDNKVKTSISFTYHGDASLTFYSRVEVRSLTFS